MCIVEYNFDYLFAHLIFFLLLFERMLSLLLFLLNVPVGDRVSHSFVSLFYASMSYCILGDSRLGLLLSLLTITRLEMFVEWVLFSNSKLYRDFFFTFKIGKNWFELLYRIIESYFFECVWDFFSKKLFLDVVNGCTLCLF